MRASGNDTIRTFVAIELDDEVKRHITAAIDELRHRQIDSLRLVRPEGVHLTLKFLGDIDAARVPQIAEAMTTVAAWHEPFSLTLGTPGAFPSATRARVLWLGVEGRLQRLRLLQADMDEALTEIGFPAERHSFNPHLTIGRIHHRAPGTDRHRAADALTALPTPADQAIAVNGISLMKSTLRPDGTVHERIAYKPLSDPHSN